MSLHTKLSLTVVVALLALIGFGLLLNGWTLSALGVFGLMLLFGFLAYILTLI